MSCVTNIILSFGANNGENYHLLDAINAWLTKHNYGDLGHGIDSALGGILTLKFPVYAARFNYFDADEFIVFLKTLEWTTPQNVQLFIEEYGDAKFSLIEIAANGAVGTGYKKLRNLVKRTFNSDMQAGIACSGFWGNETEIIDSMPKWARNQVERLMDNEGISGTWRDGFGIVLSNVDQHLLDDKLDEMFGYDKHNLPEWPILTE